MVPTGAFRCLFAFILGDKISCTEIDIQHLGTFEIWKSPSLVACGFVLPNGADPTLSYICGQLQVVLGWWRTVVLVCVGGQNDLT